MTSSIDEIEERLRSLEAKEQIREVLYLYCRAADRCDSKLMLSCYHDDAEDDHGFFSGKAKEFVPHVISELSKLALSVHSISNVIIVLDGRRAFVESHYAVIHRLRHWLGFTDFYHLGRYLDIFECRQSGWKIAKRVIVQDGERWFQTADLWPLLRGKPNTPKQGSHAPGDDPVYLGFEVGSLIRTRPRVPNLWIGFYRLALTPLLLIRMVLLFIRTFQPKDTTDRS